MKGVDSLKALVLAALLSLGEHAMAAEVNLWVLDEAPIAQDRPGTELELFGVQQTMGSGGERKSVEGRVTLAEPLVFAPPGGAGSANPAASQAYYLVKVPFTVHRLSGGRNYDRLELRVKLGDPAAMGFMLIPDAVITEEDVQRTYNLSAGLARAGVNLGGSGSYVVSFKRIVPIVRAYGEASPEFYWEFKREDSGPPLLGSHGTLVILRVPQDTKIIQGELYAEALIESRFPWIEKEKIFSDRKQVEWDLGKAEPIDAIPWTKAVIDDSLLQLR